MVVAYAPLEWRKMPRDGWWIADVVPPEETFGAWLDGVLRARRMKQAHLARHLGYENAGRISGYVQGRYHPEADEMQRIADFFGVPFAHLRELKRRDQDRKEYPPDPLPGPGIAVPDVPVMRDLLVTLVELSDDDLHDIAQFAQGRSKGQQAGTHETRTRRAG